jgi:hypothetical protein
MCVSLNLNNLPSKFKPFLLGEATDTIAIKEQIDEAFVKGPTYLKSTNIFTAGNWILKKGRTDGLLTTPDTHLYRVRKAEKIRKYIADHHLEAHLMVPKKYLYWRESEKQFYVVSEKVTLSEAVAKPVSTSFENQLKAIATLFGGQLKALSENKPQKVLTDTQAKALAELSTIGYTDLTYNNLFFTPDGKIAIIDTEPQKRALKKLVCKSKLAWFFGNKASLLTAQALVGIAKLKLYCNSKSSQEEVSKVEKRHALKDIAKLVGKIALLSFALYLTCSAVALLPISTTAIAAITFTLTSITVIKSITLALGILNTLYAWYLSSHYETSLPQIGRLEAQGFV